MAPKLPTSEGEKRIQENLSLFTEGEQNLIKTLLSLDQGHIFASFDPPGTNDSKKKAFIKQLTDINNVYPGGIKAYIERAKNLLHFSAIGGNPYEGFTCSEPKNAVRLESMKDFDYYEEKGISLEGLGSSGFVIVAGGLGERLGYKGIKLALPSEITTEKSFIQLYIEQIQAIQLVIKERTGKDVLLPLAIMTSDDTDQLTQELLKKHNNFGMAPGQLIVFKQGKVPSMIDNDAHFTVDEKDPYVLDTKPHGHGDVHSLLYSEKIIEKWVQNLNTKYVVFMQDTNGMYRMSLCSHGKFSCIACM
jgi:UDP-sugar pyrophosphorylase